MSHTRIGTACGLVVVAAISIGLARPASGITRQQARSGEPELRADSVVIAQGLQADLAILRRAYETLHPGLLRYNTPAQMDDAFGALQREFARDRTLADAYLAFSIFAARIKCGHTYPNFFNQPEAIERALFRGGRVPYYFRWIGNRMVVTRPFAADGRLVPGAEVLAINGVATSDILARLMTVARADGGNDEKRRAYLEVQGTSRLEAFDVYFPLFFPSADSALTLRVRRPTDVQPREFRVRAATYDERLAALPPSAANDARSSPLWTLEVADAGVAVLRMPTWALYNSKWNWQAFLQGSMVALVDRGVSDLVIDLRGNEGGNDVGSALVSHLAEQPVPRPPLTKRVRYQKVPDDLVPYLDTWDPSFRDWGPAASQPSGGFYRLRRDANDDPGGVIRPGSPRFRGRTWVLVGASNSSATFEFAQIVRQNRLATLVGQTTGGNQRGINGGAFFFLRLPNSRIELDLPLIGQFPDAEAPDAGIDPDIRVTVTVDDIARGRDSELEAALAAIREKRQPAPGR